ncbi:MAG: hypothetical protein OXI96_10160 [Acidimicrobiaceae bacterium]|nr:hypothetical protein [Acidimicrobiaceae bacterium]
MTILYDSEKALVSELRNHVRELWGEHAHSKVEVPCHDQARMDVLVQTPTCLIAVEAKLSNWNRVVAQAYLHRYCADLVYIAVLENMITQDRLDEAGRFAIGVISVANGSTRIMRTAVQGHPNMRIRERIASTSILSSS